ncbi:hypothetical protein PS647_04048 [Pseudomonas fluorescens]|jgi:5-methylcytosine-specific restriction endonuclease McrA|uniref:HNH endonuclease n=1 Tax=Pseudomonas fluorescens TaxID=294 RepID=UPI00123F06CC|nr:HNH endonuclease [Pseudomonas fluorescens]VVN14941.1 hypothetical protein PS647_04048 [Pseudomonas fluorescens]
MADKSVIKHRFAAFDRQGGRCYYCGFQMWRDTPEAFARRHGLSLRQARHFQCTAEHLVARQDGGRDTQSNIAAACQRCNQGRHKRKEAPEPQEYKALVEKRLSKGGWHPLPAGTHLF